MKLVDSHCHLNLFNEQDLNELIRSAKNNDVVYLHTICTSLEDLPQILKIINKYNNVFGSVGLHPTKVESFSISNEDLINIANHPKIISFGETGLDYYQNNIKKETQILSFIEHVSAAQETNIPIVIHSRNADEDLVNILNDKMKKKSFTGLIHCFTSSKILATKILDMGMYISISGIITFKNAENLREVVKFIPSNRLLIETDAPYLAPVPMRGKDNKPCFLKYTACAIAELKNINLTKLADITTENFFKLFNKAILD